MKINPIKRALGTLAVAATALLALSGCMKLDMDITVNENDTMDASMVFAFSDQLAELMGTTPQELWDMAGADITGELPEDVVTEPYSQDGFTGMRMHMTQEPLDAADGIGGEELSIVRDGDEFVLHGVMDLNLDDLDQLPSGLMDNFDVRINVTFPGEVLSHDGSLSGTTVTWTPAMGTTTEMNARALATGGGGAGGLSPLVWVGIIVGALALAAIAALLYFGAKQRKATAAADEPALVDPNLAPTTPVTLPASIDQVPGYNTGAAPVAPAGDAAAPVADPSSDEVWADIKAAAANVDAKFNSSDDVWGAVKDAASAADAKVADVASDAVDAVKDAASDAVKDITD